VWVSCVLCLLCVCSWCQGKFVCLCCVCVVYVRVHVCVLCKGKCVYVCVLWVCFVCCLVYVVLCVFVCVCARARTLTCNVFCVCMCVCVCVYGSYGPAGDGHLIVDYQELQLTHRQGGNDSSDAHVYLVSSGGDGQRDEKEVDEKEVGGIPSYGAIPKGQKEPFLA